MCIQWKGLPLLVCFFPSFLLLPFWVVVGLAFQASSISTTDYGGVLAEGSIGRERAGRRRLVNPGGVGWWIPWCLLEKRQIDSLEDDMIESISLLWAWLCQTAAVVFFISLMSKVSADCLLATLFVYDSQILGVFLLLMWSAQLMRTMRHQFVNVLDYYTTTNPPPCCHLNSAIKCD